MNSAAPTAPDAVRAPWLAPLGAGAFVLIWCAGYPVAKIAVSHGGAFTTLDLRFGCAALVFGALAAFARVAWPSRRAVLHSVVVGLLQLVMHFGALYGALQLGASAGIAALVTGAMPLAVSLMATALGERIGRRQWLGLAIGFVGVLLVIGERLLHASASGPAILLLIVALIGISGGTLYQKRHGSTLDLRLGLFIQNLTAALVLLPLAWLLEHFRADGSPAFWAATAWLVLVNAIGGFALLFVLIRGGAATQVATLFFLVPATGALMGHFVLGEVLTTLEIVGFVVAAVGVYLGTHVGRGGG